MNVPPATVWSFSALCYDFIAVARVVPLRVARFLRRPPQHRYTQTLVFFFCAASENEGKFYYRELCRWLIYSRRSQQIEKSLMLLHEIFYYHYFCRCKIVKTEVKTQNKRCFFVVFGGFLFNFFLVDLWKKEAIWPVINASHSNSTRGEIGSAWFPDFVRHLHKVNFSK